MDKLDKYDYHEKYAYLEREYLTQDRRERRRRQSNQKGQMDGRTQKQIAKIEAEIAAMDDGIDTWVPSYAAALDPLHFERQWVIDSVGHFYRQNIITDVTRLVKGGKEANVYACVGHEATGMDLIAAKLYRPRMLRHLKNDAIYKAGRLLRDAEGKQLKGRREKLALRKKTDFGKKVDIQWWIGNEYRTQTKLYEAGGDVPKPIAHQGNTILMAYVGDAYGPAPTLSEISLAEAEAQPLFERVMHNVALMLDNHYVHGDLSAYNILYWDGQITIIDFPQMVEARHNPHAYDLLLRDVTRVCDYFAGCGVDQAADPKALTDALWRPYMGEVPYA